MILQIYEKKISMHAGITKNSIKALDMFEDKTINFHI